jgi:hypothetical protein
MADKIEIPVYSSGRVSYKELCVVVPQVHIDTFAAQYKVPFLVGKELYAGQMARDADTLTMKFSRSQLLDKMQAAAGAATVVARSPAALPPPPGEPNGDIASAIYVFRKKKLNDLGPLAFTLGRGMANDVVIMDNSVSTTHAVFDFSTPGMVGIEDLGSTNGTMVNGTPLKSKSKCMAALGTEVTLGRLCFVIASARDLYDHIAVRVM